MESRSYLLRPERVEGQRGIAQFIPQSRGLLAEICLYSTIYVEDLSVYKIGGLGCEEYGGTCEVFGIAPTACGSLGVGDEAVEWML